MFVNGMDLQQLIALSTRVTREALALVREVRIAVNAFVLLEDSDHAAWQEKILARRDRGLIAQFRSAMTRPGAAVWSGLSEARW